MNDVDGMINICDGFFILLMEQFYVLLLVVWLVYVFSVFFCHCMMKKEIKVCLNLALVLQS